MTSRKLNSNSPVVIISLYFMITGCFASNHVFGDTADAAKQSCELTLEEEEQGICIVQDNNCECLLTVSGAEAKEMMDASYAVGVKFSREVTSQFDGFNYEQFLIGVRDATSNSVIKNRSELENSVAAVVVKSIQSDKFLKDFIEFTDVVPMDGIYVIKDIVNRQIEDAKDVNEKEIADKTDAKYIKKTSEGNILLECPDSFSADRQENEYSVAYVRLDLDAAASRMYSSDGSSGCINVDKSQMIRGWRIALGAMETGDNWEVVIPAELGYGSEGVSGIVDEDVALRFHLELLDKP